jgi:hypothetical protein
MIVEASGFVVRGAAAGVAAAAAAATGSARPPLSSFLTLSIICWVSNGLSM